jgi:hypothetical protein
MLATILLHNHHHYDVIRSVEFESEVSHGKRLRAVRGVPIG